MDKVFADLSKGGFVWLPEHGIGYYPVRLSENTYDDSYFAKYQQYAETEMGRAITAARVGLVTRYCAEDPVIDIGIGCGDFIAARGGATYGYDINRAGVRWLIAHDKLRDPYVDRARGFHPAITCWDSLEHIPDPGQLLSRVSGFVFVSVPIFRDAEHILRSKHFRKDEHFWYWTDAGIRLFMSCHGFRVVEANQMETDLGREGITTYAFQRVAWPNTY